MSSDRAILSEIPVVILAGGLGTRIRQVIGEMPKPLAPILGRPVLEWLIRYLAVQGAKQVIISTGYHGEMIEAFAKDRTIAGVSMSCFREPEPLGTGGGFAFTARASGLAPKAWLVMNGDSFALIDLPQLAERFQASAPIGAIAGLEVEDASRYGRLETDSEGRVLAFLEKQPGAGLINAGMYLLDHSLLENLPPGEKASLEREVFPALTRRRPGLIVQRFHAPFLDIGTPESLALADNFVRQHSHFFSSLT